jgi:DNA-binding NtrC family response regulator
VDIAGSGAIQDLAGKPLADIEKQVILSTLQRFRGHRIKTASALGIGVRTLGMKLKKWREEGELVEAGA